MRRAAEISREGHEAAAKLARGGVYEYELAAVLDYTFRRRGGAGPAYESIVGGGANATILHYVSNDQPLRDGDLVLIDAGCEVAGYASDVTRCYPAGGRFSGPARDVYEVVLAAQHAALDVSRPGSTLDEVHERRAAESRAGHDRSEAARGLGRRCDPERRLQDLLHAPHQPLARARRARRRLVRGGRQAATARTGHRVHRRAGSLHPGAREKAPAPLRGIGVRIEDDVLVTADGHENLTAAIPKRVADVEALYR